MTATPGRILVVDDDPAALRLLLDQLKPLPGWEVQGVASAAQGLEALAQQPYQAVLADLNMPGMGGLAMLQELMARYPAAQRIITFEPGEREEALACLGWAHQFLAKPIDPAYLQVLLQDVQGTGARVDNSHVRELVARIGQLPAVPSLYREITTLLECERCTSEMIGKVIAKDMAMTAMILKLANSAYFGLRNPVSSAAEATSYLGVDLVKGLVLGYGLFGQVGAFRIPTFTLSHLWNHSLGVAVASRGLAELQPSGPAHPNRDTCFTAGLLHDIGLLVLASRFPEDYLQVLERTRTAGGDLELAETSVFGAAHGAVGAYLLSLWGLPAPLVEAAAFHHAPSRQAIAGFTPALAVHVADAFQAPRAEHELFATAHLDLEYLGALGLLDRLPAWREAAGRGGATEGS